MYIKLIFEFNTDISKNKVLLQAENIFIIIGVDEERKIYIRILNYYKSSNKFIVLYSDKGYEYPNKNRLLQIADVWNRDNDNVFSDINMIKNTMKFNLIYISIEKYSGLFDKCIKMRIAEVGEITEDKHSINDIIIGDITEEEAMAQAGKVLEAIGIDEKDIEIMEITLGKYIKKCYEVDLFCRGNYFSNEERLLKVADVWDKRSPDVRETEWRFHGNKLRFKLLYMYIDIRLIVEENN